MSAAALRRADPAPKKSWLLSDKIHNLIINFQSKQAIDRDPSRKKKKMMIIIMIMMIVIVVMICDGLQSDDNFEYWFPPPSDELFH